MLGGLGLVLALAAIGVTAVLIWQSRMKALYVAEAELRRLSFALAEQTARTIQSADLALQSTAEAYQLRLARGPVDRVAMRQLLSDRLAAVPQVIRAHGIVANDGTVYSSRTAAPASPVTGQMESFAAHRDSPDLGLRVAAPRQSATDGNWGMYLTRRINGPAGDFAGVVYVFLAAEYFENLFEALQLGGQSAIALVSRDNRLIARFPRLPQAVGQAFPQAFTFRVLLKGADHGSWITGQSALDGASRAAAAQELPNLPLVMIVSTVTDAILADWRREAAILGIGTVGVTTLLALIWTLVRQLRRHEQTATALDESRRTLETAQAVAHIGSWVSDLQHSRTLSWSPEMFRIVGVDPRSWDGQLASFYALVHPDDRDNVRSAAAAALETGGRYSVEHRIIRPEGTVRWLHEQAEIIRDEAGRARMVGTAHDITERRKTEEALRLTETRLRDYAETASDWYWETGADHRFTYVSTRIRQFRFSEVPLLGKTRLELSIDAEEQPDKWRNHYMTLERHEPFRDFVYKRDGKPPVYVSISGKPIFDAMGKFLGYRGSARDVTAMITAEERLRASEARQRDYAETASDWYWEADSDYRFTYVSSRVRLFGMDEEARIGKTRMEIAADRDEQPEKWREHNALVARREPFRDFVYKMQVPGEAEHFISVSGKPVFDAAGTFLGYRGTARDITEILRAEEALRLSEARLRDYAETASDWYWETGPDHRFTYMSTRIRAFGMDETAWIGRRRIDNAGDTDEEREKWRKHIAQLDRHEPFRNFIYKTDLTLGKRETWISVSGKPVFDGGGKFLGYRGTGREITAAIQAEAKLREAKVAAESASAAKTAFLANMSHELRTPLNAIIGFAEALSAGYFGTLNDRQAEYLRDIQTSGNHLLMLITDLLDVSKIEAGKLELYRESLDVAEEIHACLRLVRSKADEGRVSVVANLPDDLPRYHADRRAVKQVLLNLLSNAVKFTLPGGKVTVEATADPDGDLKISVSDTGIGIAPQDLPKIILPFGTLARNASLSRPREGTGLGLPLSKSLIEMHGGRLEIVSELGRGTIATVRFPPAPGGGLRN
jgi:two-component system cell cycle sensor histidine kinase PleC